MAGVYTALPGIASETRQHDKTLTKATATIRRAGWSAARPRPSEVRSCFMGKRHHSGFRTQLRRILLRIFCKILRALRLLTLRR